MLSIFLAAAVSEAPSSTDASSKSAATTATPSDTRNLRCATGRNRLRSQESLEAWDANKQLKKDDGGGVPPQAQAILNQMTEMFEKDDSRGSSDMAEMMREFAGGKAERRTAC